MKMTTGKVSFAYESQSTSNLSKKKRQILLIVVTICAVIGLKESIHSIQSHILRNGSNYDSSSNVKKMTTVSDTGSKCWLKNEFEAGNFIVYSHRSFFNHGSKVQPTCKNALTQLRDIGVNHLDLDLVLDEKSISENGNNNNHPTIYVSHPMEFKKESSYYSPCAVTPLNELITILNDVYGDKNWFFSLEPKASWGRSEKEINDLALVEPMHIMTQLLAILEQFNMERSQCAVIIDVKTLHGSEEQQTFERLLKHCQLFVGRRKTDIVEDSLDADGYRYDKIMPTIEFHPNHKGNQGLVVPSNIHKDSIFWTVDNINDLLLAAQIRPTGIVSNTPEDIIRIIKSETWCHE